MFGSISNSIYQGANCLLSLKKTQRKRTLDLIKFRAYALQGYILRNFIFPRNLQTRFLDLKILVRYASDMCIKKISQILTSFLPHDRLNFDISFLTTYVLHFLCTIDIDLQFYFNSFVFYR